MSGQITRKDIITDEALQWGSEYAKILDKAIDKNREFVDTLIALNAENIKLRKAEDRIEYLKQRNEANLLSEKSILSLKEQKTLEISLEKIKQEKLRTEKLELDVLNKKATAQKRNNTLTIEERVQNEINNKLLKQAAREKLGLVGAYEKLNNARTQAKNKLRDLIAAEIQNTEAIKKAQIEFDRLDSKVKKADTAVRDFTKNVGNYPQIKSLTIGLFNLVAAFGLFEGVRSFSDLLSNAYETIKEFEKGVADLRAITGATGKDLDFLKNSALDLGKTVKGGAIAVVEAYKLIASAKPELLENVKALNSVTESAIQLSQAAGMELPEAATALTDALNQFNAPAEKAGEFVDALANGAKYGAAEIPQTTEALLKFGAVARTSNISIQESVALIELLAENGIKGAEAGTKLRNVLLKISAPDALPKEAKKVFKELGISLEFLKDQTIPIQEKLAALKPLLKDNSSIVKIFGDENATAAINVLSHTDRLAELIPKMSEFGTAAEQAEIRMDTLNGKTEILKSTYDSFVLSVGKGSGSISKALGTVVTSFTGVLLILERINTSWDELYEKASNQGSKLGDSTFKSLMNGKSGEEAVKQAEQNIRLARRNLQTLDAQLAETNKNIEEDSAFGAISVLDGTRKTLLGLKRDKEAILKTQAEMARLMQSSKDFLIPDKTETVDETGGNGSTESDADRAKILAAQKKAIEEYIKLLEKRNKDEFDLNQFRIEREIYYNQLIVDDETKTNEERVNAFLQIEQLKKASLDNVLANELRVNALGSESLKTKTKAEIDAVLTRTNLEAKSIIINGELKKNATTEEIAAYEKYILDLQKLDDKRKLDQQKLIDSQVAIVQKGIDQELLKNDTLLNEKVEKENEFYAKQILDAKGNQEALEKAEEEHQNRLFEIKKEFARKGLKILIDNLEAQLAAQLALPKSERVSAEEIIKIQNKVSKARAEYNEQDAKKTKETADKKVVSEEEWAQKVKDLAFQLKDALVDFGNAIFGARISNIDAEIQANDDYYNQQIELAGNDARQKDILEKERENKRLQLEKKKRKAEYDAAVFNKAAQAAQIIGATSLAVISTLAQVPKFDFGVSATALAGVVATIGAIQLATLLATPLPKYKHGRKGGPAEFAITGDGGRAEVISNPDGSNPRLTPKVPTFTYLNENDFVHKSVNDYNSYIRASLLKEYDKSANDVKQYQINVNENQSNSNLDKIIEKGIIDGFKKAKNNVSINNNIDISHEIWKLGNTNWSKK